MSDINKSVSCDNVANAVFVEYYNASGVPIIVYHNDYNFYWGENALEKAPTALGGEEGINILPP